ncbi:MAG: PEP-utilizing enzyme [Butyricicoccus sp.]
MTNTVTDEGLRVEPRFVNCENFQAMFRALDDEYMQARAADIGDISQRVIKNLKGIADNAIDTITEPCIIVANDLTPSDTAKIGGKPVAGFITKIGGRTSHSAIMARSMGIPAIVGAGEKADEIADGDLLLIDGAAGEVVAQPDEQTRRLCRAPEGRCGARAMLAKARIGGRTGRPPQYRGNIGTPDDAVRVAELGEGVGLFRRSSYHGSYRPRRARKTACRHKKA